MILNIGGSIMNLKELFEKYGHVEVFAVEDNVIKSYHQNGCDGVSTKEIERHLCDVGEFIPRYRAELDREYRQIIPYCMIICEDKIFTTRRLKGDERLVGKYSIGIGGHIEKEDREGDSLIRNALYRELDEEVYMKSEIDKIELLGCIYMNDTPVDSVHYGLAYGIYVDGFDVKVKEVDTLEGSWHTRDELLRLRDNLEKWSIYCIEELL